MKFPVVRPTFCVFFFFFSRGLASGYRSPSERTNWAMLLLLLSFLFSASCCSADCPAFLTPLLCSQRLILLIVLGSIGSYFRPASPYLRPRFLVA